VRSQEARAEARMFQILEDERQELFVVGCERKQGESIGGLMSE
jgi:hypothetical protein